LYFIFGFQSLGAKSVRVRLFPAVAVGVPGEEPYRDIWREV